jgi:glutamate-1-semialdehyde 2,1-aminomutase
VKFATSGTHGNSAAIKLARVHTGKEKVLKFEGGYHGHVDALAYNGGSNVAAPGSRNDPYTVPMEPGLTPGSAEGVEVLPWNDADLLAETLERQGDEIAAVIAEPIPANAGLFWPADGYLERVRDLTREHDVVLIFDEVVTGFRVSLHGAQGYLDVEPDLAVFGKGLGNGLPVAALVGRREVMDEYDDHAVFSGTYSGGPLALAGTHANLRALRAAGEETYEAVRDRSQRLCEGLHEIAADAGHAVCPSRAAGFFKLNLVDERVDAIREWRDVHEHVRSETVTAFAREMIGEGSFIYPGHSRIALTTAHTDAHTERTLEHAKAAFERVPS